jgi:NADH-quinone oxidoreductase subunit G
VPKIIIDDLEIEVPKGITIIQAAELAEIEIPHFCYHARLNIAGNCRMCLVEVEKSPKPVASCAMPVSEGMVIHTTSLMVQKAREGVMEFLLINHPLDCPICDQGGECDLQDQAMAYGRGQSRYTEEKRAVTDKYMGPLIRTHMTRCIHCTRCVRFANDVAGVSELGTLGRGEDMQIVSYLDQALTSELSGNLIDLCPVGALTSKPYAFKGRPWDLTKTETIDVMDAVGSNIRVDSHGAKVMRILPSLHEGINEEWISNKTRFACDGLVNQRLDQPYVRVDGKLQPATWDEAFQAIANRLRNVPGERIGAIAGDLIDVEAMVALKDLWAALGSSHIDCRQDGAALSTVTRAHYLFNTKIAGIEEADACLIVGASPRYDAPLINARLRKRFLKGNFPIAYLGGAFPPHQDLTFSYNALGDDPKVMEQILAGSHPFAKILAKAKNPMIILGCQALTREDSPGFLEIAGKIAETSGMICDDWNGFNILHNAASRVGGLDIGFLPGLKGFDVKEMRVACAKGQLEVLYLLGADEINFEGLENTFIIYQGHHGDQGAQHADVILPGAAYTEKSATYVNTEGRVQRTQRAVFPPGEAKEDWRIIRALSEVLGYTLGYDNAQQIQARMIEINPVFSQLDTVQSAVWQTIAGEGALSQNPFSSARANFYMTDPISRHSPTMARCHQELGSQELSLFPHPRAGGDPGDI